MGERLLTVMRCLLQVADCLQRASDGLERHPTAEDTLRYVRDMVSSADHFRERACSALEACMAKLKDFMG